MESRVLCRWQKHVMKPFSKLSEDPQDLDFLLHEVSPIFLIWTPAFSDPVVTWQPLSFKPQQLLHFSFQASFAVAAYKGKQKRTTARCWGDKSSTTNPYSTLCWEMLCTTYLLLQTVQCLTTRLVTTRSVPANSPNLCFPWHAGVLRFLPCKYCNSKCSSLSFA